MVKFSAMVCSCCCRRYFFLMPLCCKWILSSSSIKSPATFLHHISWESSASYPVFLLFTDRHDQGFVKRLCNLARIIGIDHNGFCQFYCGPGHFAQDKHAAFPALAATNSFATRFIPSRRGVTRATLLTWYSAISSSRWNSCRNNV